ncbi:unnamed protein product [Trypanosoma congolense IL3000]|uniref:WGS project CAEQ00000000 data, annotated contig 1643 n=1 Tax=Trypanosoma congolense (strain IL3000) TaxID=1068625 RepID=F9W7R1_TRYCI|nr:unnamed protein product [Trypanosoma congolense IL3000]
MIIYIYICVYIIRMCVCVMRGCCCCVLVCVRCPSFVRIIPIRIRPGVVCGVCWGNRTWWGAAVVPAAISKTRLGARTCPNTRPPCRSLSLVLRGCLRLCARPARARRRWRGGDDVFLCRPTLIVCALARFSPSSSPPRPHLFRAFPRVLGEWRRKCVCLEEEGAVGEIW